MADRNEILYSSALDAEAVDKISEYVRNYLKAQKFSSKDIIRYAFTVEDLLIRTMEEGGEEREVSFSQGKKFFTPFFAISISGKTFNAFSGDEEDGSTLGNYFLKSTGLSPEYIYTLDNNQYTFSLRNRKKSPAKALVIAFVAAIIVGLLGLLMPDGLRTTINDGILTPLHDAFLNVLGCIAGLMIFLSVAWGIYGIGDTATLKQVGKKIILAYIGTIFIGTMVITLLALPFFNLRFSQQVNGAGGILTVFGMFLDIIPGNFFTPFETGNTLQIIFLAIVFGVALLFLGRKTKEVVTVVEQLNSIVQLLIGFISSLVPFFIFLVLVGMIWSNTFSILWKASKYFIFFAAAILLFSIALIIICAIRNRVKPSRLIRKGIPTFLIALTTASSAASFATNIKACTEQYGISDKIASFGLPLGVVMFKPGTSVCLMATALVFSESYGVEISLSWIVIMIISTVMLSIATPPIPGGGLMMYTVFLTQLGIPSEALAIVLMCDVMVDFFSTAFNQYLIAFTLLTEASRLGMVDRDILIDRKKKQAA